MIYTTFKIIILYLLSIALWGVEKFHSILFDYGWWKPVALLYLPLLIISFGQKKDKMIWRIINIAAVILLVTCITLSIAYFVGYADTFLGAVPLKKLRHDDKVNIAILIGTYILLKVIGAIFIEDENKKQYVKK